MVRQQYCCSGRVPGRRSPGWRWVGLWLEVDESAPCGRCEDATRAVRSWRDCEQWSLGMSVLCESTRGRQWSGGSGGRVVVVVVGQGVPAAAAAARAPLVRVRALLAEAMTCHTQPRGRSNSNSGVHARPDDVCYNGQRLISICISCRQEVSQEYQSHWQRYHIAVSQPHTALPQAAAQ